MCQNIALNIVLNRTFGAVRSAGVSLTLYGSSLHSCSLHTCRYVRDILSNSACPSMRYQSKILFYYAVARGSARLKFWFLFKSRGIPSFFLGKISESSRVCQASDGDFFHSLLPAVNVQFFFARDVLSFFKCVALKAVAINKIITKCIHRSTYRM